MLNRRYFIASNLTAGAAIGLSAPHEQSHNLSPLCVFAKPLQWLSFDALADYLDEYDWDGIEATVRRGGQVEPEKIEELGRLVDSLDRKNKSVTLFASDINSVEQPLTEKTLRKASQLGIRYYRMSYYRYDLDKPILPQLDHFARQAEQLAQLNETLGMTALYQNHAGTKYVGAGLWDLQHILANQSREHLAVAFDIRHATVEATNSWPVHWSMLKEQVGALYFKDFVWDGIKPKNVPLGTGLVSKDFYKEVQSESFASIPISIHMEYVDHRKPELIDESKRSIASDRRATKRLLQR